MALNLSDYQAQIRAFILDKIRVSYPEIDPSRHAVIDDLIINPITTIVSDLYQDMTTLAAQSNLNNASALTEDQLDMIGDGNYYLPRKPGVNGSTILTISFLSFDTTLASLNIPSNTFFSTETGYQFKTTDSFVFYGPFDRYLNKKTSTYDFNITVSAVAEGPEYNVDANTITKILNTFDPKTTRVTNKKAVTNGAAREDNISYANRIRGYYITRQINTAPGYRNLIMDLLPDIIDVLVIGFREDEMMRDLYAFGSASKIPILSIHIKDDTDTIDKNTITISSDNALLFSVGEDVNVVSYQDITTQILAIDPDPINTDNSILTIDQYPDQYWTNILYEPSQNDRFVHLGGKVDIYLKGVSNNNETTFSESYSNVLLFPSRYDSEGNLLDVLHFCYMTEDGSGNPIPVPPSDYTYRKTLITDFNGAFAEDYTVFFYNPSDISTTSYVVQIFDDNKYNTVIYSIKDTVIDLETPLAFPEMINNIVSMEIDGVKIITNYSLNDFVINRGPSEYIGSSMEYCNVVFHNSPTNAAKYMIPNLGTKNGVPSPILFGITYKIIDSINTVVSSLNTPRNRNLCADVLIKSANPAYIHLKLPVIIKPEYIGTGDEVRNRIQNSIERYFLELPLGETMTVTDLLAWLYSDPNVYPFIISVNLNQLEYWIIDGEAVRHSYRNDMLPIYRIEYPYLYDFSVVYIES